MTDREILRLAVPAFLALVAEPLFLLADAAIVGHLGTPQLAGLGIAGAVVQTAVGLCIFLAYGTTASVARRIGAGDVRGALAQGIDGVWLAVLIGAAVTVVGVATAAPLVDLFHPSPEVADHATTYLRWAFLGVTPLLVMLASIGILRGLQDTRTPLVIAVAGSVANVVLNLLLVYGLDLGIAGSAIGTDLAQLGSAAALIAVVVRAARREGASLRPDFPGVRRAAHAGIALVIRTLTLRASLLVMTYGAATLGATATASQQLAMTLWTFLAFALDAIAIAAQAITGRYLGAGDLTVTRQATDRMVRWGLMSGVVTGALLALSAPLLGRLFTSDPAVHAELCAGAPGRRPLPAGRGSGVRPRRRTHRRRGRPLPRLDRSGGAGGVRPALLVGGLRHRGRPRARRALARLRRRLHGQPRRGPPPACPRHHLDGHRGPGPPVGFAP